MTDQRLRELFDERVADVTDVDLVDAAWQRAHAVRRRRAVVAVVAAVVAIVGTTAVVVGTNDGEPPPVTTPSTDGLKAVRSGTYSHARVWWGPTTEQEAELPALAGTALPREIDLSPEASMPTGSKAIAIFQLWRETPGEVVVVGADGTSYSLDVSGLAPVPVDGQEDPPLSASSLASDGRRAVFAQEGSVEVYDFVTGRWTSIPTEHAETSGVHWSEDGSLIIVPRPGTGPIADLYSPSGDRRGHTLDEDDYFSLRTANDTGHGQVVRNVRGDGARGLGMGGPVSAPDGSEHRGVEAFGAGGRDWPEDLLAFPPESGGGRWKQCCPAVGWLDADTVLLQSRHEDARILGWRPRTGEVLRVSDIRGWKSGEESYVASFAAIDGSVGTGPGGSEAAGAADAEVQGVPVWWSPDVAGEAVLPWLEQSVLPREIDVEAAVEVAPVLEPGSVPFDRAVAAFPYPDPQRPEWVVLIGPDLALAKLDVGRLEEQGDAGASYDLATRNMLSSNGRRLVFGQDGFLWVVTLGTGEWRRIDTGDDVTGYPAWVENRYLLLPPAGSDTGPLYTLDGRSPAEGGIAPDRAFHVGSSSASQSGPVKPGPGFREAHAWDGRPSLPVPTEGSGRYLSDPPYLEVVGQEDLALAFVERVGQERWIYGPVAVGWLDEETVVYESETEAGHLLIAWRIGTREFWKVAEIDGSPGTFLGGPSFADLHR